MHEVPNEIDLTIRPLSKIVPGVTWVDVISNSIWQFFEGPKIKTKCAIRECSPGSKTNVCERVLIHSIHLTFNCGNDLVVSHA